MRGGSGAEPVTRREREVAVLIAEGLTDRDIAERLYISLRTAQGHVKQLRAKLRFDNRVQIARWVMSQRRDEFGTPIPSNLPPPHNLPAHVTTFVGREREMGEIRRRLQRARLVTITGPGGCGKTRLAIEVASELLHRYPNGVTFVDLSSADDRSRVPGQIRAALGIVHRGRDDDLEAIRAELAGAAGSDRLLILDNCEHLVETCAGVAGTLLRINPRLTVLCTTREPLHIAGEAVWKLGPLSLPGPGDDRSLAAVRQSEAVRLFADRAALSDPEFELNDDNAADVAQLCHRLDGIPLALELAAARVGLMSFGQLVSMVEKHLSAPYLRSLPARHQTLTATIGWSYDLLGDPARRLLERLSVFRGGFTVEAAAAVNGASLATDRKATLELLDELVDKSLVLLVPPHRERYRCLGVIQRFASQKLAERGDLETTRSRHLDLFLAVAEGAAAHLRGSEQPRWLERLDEEHDNLRVAVRTSRDRDVGRRVRLVLALELYWRIRGYLREGRESTDQAVSAARDLGATAQHATLLNAAAGFAWLQGDQGAAEALLERSLVMWRQLGNRKGIQFCLGNLGLLALQRSDRASARYRLRESLALARELRDDLAVAVVLNNLGLATAMKSEYETASAQFVEALTILDRVGDRARSADVLANLGMLDLYRRQPEGAVEHYSKALEIVTSVHAPIVLAECLEGLAVVATERGRRERAGRLVGAALSIRESVGRPRPPWLSKLMDGWATVAEVSSPRAADPALDEAVALATLECCDDGGG